MYKTNFYNVQPEQKFLDIVNSKKRFFHYVPIEQTIRVMFKNKSFESRSLTSHKQRDDILRDFSDGTVY